MPANVRLPGRSPQGEPDDHRQCSSNERSDGGDHRHPTGGEALIERHQRNRPSNACGGAPQRRAHIEGASEEHGPGEYDEEPDDL
jgi:hypothetical protein